MIHHLHGDHSAKFDIHENSPAPRQHGNVMYPLDEGLRSVRPEGLHDDR
jgi:hypothetical protein